MEKLFRENRAEKNLLASGANKLRPQTQSTGFSDTWANQRLESLLPFGSWWNLRASSSINPSVSHCAQSGENFFCCSFFSTSCWNKMGKATKGTAARKQTKAAARPSSETQGLLTGKMRYFRAKVYFKSWRAPGNLFLPNQFQKWSNSVPLIGQKNIFLPNQGGRPAG